MKTLTTPLSENVVRSLHAGDLVLISGVIYTMRDEAHLKALDEGSPVPLEGAAVYHCGPVARKKDGSWEIIAAGPTTSSRMNSVEPEFLKRFGVRAIIGKGGMSGETHRAMMDVGAVYLTWTGGAAVLAARKMKVVDVHWLDLGMPEALWILEVSGFGPLVVAMDTHGRNLYEEAMEDVRSRLPMVENALLR